MTTYNTYQEAKIANPECEIYGNNTPSFGVESAMRSMNHECYPCDVSDYCMTVERFLADGYRFVDGGLILDEGVIWTVSDKVNSDTYIYTVKSSNKPDVGDNNRYILRAAALEEEKPRTKVEYVECNEPINEIAKLMIDGEAFYSKDGGGKFYWRLNAFWRSNTALSGLNGFDFHRRIETPMTWKEELYNYLDNSCEMSDDFDDSFTIEIEGKPLEFNLNDDEFVDMCKLVASLNSVN